MNILFNPGASFGNLRSLRSTHVVLLLAILSVRCDIPFDQSEALSNLCSHLHCQPVHVCTKIAFPWDFLYQACILPFSISITTFSLFGWDENTKIVRFLPHKYLDLCHNEFTADRAIAVHYIFVTRQIHLRFLHPTSKLWSVSFRPSRPRGTFLLALEGARP